MKRPLIILFTGLIGLILAYSWSFLGKPQDAVASFERKLPGYIQQKFASTENLLQDRTFLNYFLRRDELRYLEEIEKVIHQLENLEQQEIALFISQDNKLVLSSSILDWSLSKMIPGIGPREQLYYQGEKIWVTKAVTYREHTQAVIFVPIHRAPGARQFQFLPRLDVGDRPGVRKVTVGEAGSILLYSKLEGQQPLWSLILLLSSGFLLWWYAHLQYRTFVQKNELFRAGLTVVIFAVLWWVWMQTSIWKGVHWWLQPGFNTDLLPATFLGLGLQVAVVLWLFRAFYELFSFTHFPPKRPGSFLFMVLAYLVSLLALVGVTYWLKQVMGSNSVRISLDQVVQIGKPALVVAGCMICWTMAIFLLAKRLLTFVHYWSSSLNQRILAMVIAIALNLVLVSVLELNVSLWSWGLLGFVFLMLIDLQLDSGPFNLTWLMVWLILFAAFSARFTYLYGSDAEIHGYFGVLNLFALYFSLFLLVVLGWGLLDRWIKVLPDFLASVFKTSHSLRNRIQLAVIGITLFSSVVIGWVTIWFFRESAIDAQEKTVLEVIDNLDQLLTEIPVADLPGWLKEREKEYPALRLYNASGILMYSKDTISASSWLPASILESLRIAFEPYIFKYDAETGRGMAYAPVQNSNGNIKAYLVLAFAKLSEQRSQEINNLMGSIFSLYVFFMFVAGGLAIWVANSITEPISKIGEGLRNLRLGGNAPLSWKSEDEIGLLVQEYNTALAKLEESTRQLRKAEREGAWRDMARQVAHEIKNPLTPMKLSVQHLLRAYQANPDEVGPLLQRMSHTLIEQIEGLTRIANEFSNFAQMPQANIERLPLNALIASVADLFEHQARETVMVIDLPEKEIYVLADKDQLIRVLNNLLTNAVQAIPNDRQGTINVQLEQLQGLVRVSVTDNGAGIPEDLQEKVFYPYFTTKSSGTGIGLSMCRNIMEQFGGRIYFRTQVGAGTTFYLELEAAN